MSEPVRIGVVGYGLGGRVFHAPLIASAPNAVLAGVVTTNDERRAQLAATHPGVPAVGSLGELVEAGAEAVAISSTSGTHAELAHEALDLGLHVVVDKPLAVEASSAAAIVEHAERAGLVLSVFQNRRWDSDFLTVKRVLDSGELGEVFRFESRFERWAPGPPRAWWRSELPPSEGGGVRLDLGAHLVDQALQLFGAVESVYAEAFVRRDTGRADDDLAIVLRHRNGVVSTLAANTWSGDITRRFRVLGREGAYVVGGDLEPEYITVSDDSKTAYVTLQENNAVAIVDIESARVTDIRPLGFKDHMATGMGLDASDEDGGVNTNSGTPAIKIANYPVKGMYLPDAIASYSINGVTYLVTANEGDARADWPGFNEETRVRAHCDKGLDPTVFADAANLILDSNLGRLRITTTPNGGSSGKNTSGQCTELYSFGARSFSIWDTSLKRIYDSGDELERRTQALAQALFNASHDNNTLDSRSPSKGPEPEGVAIGRFGKKFVAFIGLERIGGVMAYDVTDPTKPIFMTYFNSRSGATGDRGAEGLTLIPAHRSPNGKPLLIIGNEVSGTTTIVQVDLVP